MFKRVLIVGCAVLGVSMASLATAVADVPTLPPDSTVGLGEAEAKAALEAGGYTPFVISRHGGGAECVVFNQVSVTDYNQWVEDSETSGTYSDDDEYTVFLAVNCTS